MSSASSSAGQNQSNQKTRFLGKRVFANDAEFRSITIGSRGTSLGDGQVWSSYTPTISGGTPASTRTVNNVRYCVIGRMCHMIFMYRQPNNTGAAAGASNYGFTLPPGIKAKIIGDGTTTETRGSAVLTNGATVYTGAVVVGGAFGDDEFGIIIGRNNAGPSTWGTGFVPFDSAGTLQCTAQITFETD